MFRIDAEGQSGRYCDGLSRRSFVQVGMAGLASLSLPQLLRARNQSSAEGRKQTSTILLWLDGGPSHIDTYDMKPEAPENCRGIWKPIKTNVPGIEITEMFPRQAGLADKFALIRSLHHGEGDHYTGTHLMLTGRTAGVSGQAIPGKFPSIGSVTTKVAGPRQAGMPPYISVPMAMTTGQRPGYFGGNFLGPQYDPFQPGGDPNQDDYSIKKFNLPAKMTIDQLEDRQHLLGTLDQFRRETESSVVDTMDQFQREAYDLVASGRAATAFQMGQENPKLRERYGRNGWGQSTLLARRLVEAGATFVTVQLGGWDNHYDLEAAYKRYLPQVDSAVASLLEDLEDRGLLDTTLVLVLGEFGRTPWMNNGNNGKAKPGRDHWGRAMTCLAAGGGVQGGRVIGATDARAERPTELPLTPADLHATIFHVLGVDPKLRYPDRNGRPVDAIHDGKPIGQLF